MYGSGSAASAGLWVLQSEANQNDADCDEEDDVGPGGLREVVVFRVLATVMVQTAACTTFRSEERSPKISAE